MQKGEIHAVMSVYHKSIFKCTVTKTTWFGHICRQTGQWDRMKSAETDT